MSGQLRVLRMGKIGGRAALLQNLGHLLAVLYAICIGVSLWLMSDDLFISPRVTGLADFFVGPVK